MTNGQIAKFQELRKCHCLSRRDMSFVRYSLVEDFIECKLSKSDESWLRRLWHQYRHQIAAMKRNRR